MPYTDDSHDCQTSDLSGDKELESCPFWIESRREDTDRPGKFKKVPTNPVTGGNLSRYTKDSGLWKTYNASKEVLGQSSLVQDHGFVLTEDDPYTGIDLDDCIDRDTGEVMPWATKVMNKLDSFAYRTVGGGGLRIMVKGRTDGGNYYHEDPDTGDVHRLEAYSVGRYFTYLQDKAKETLNEAPIKEAQSFLDSLTKVQPSKKTAYPKYGGREVELPENLEQQRQKVKAVLFRNDCPPYPILEGSRSNTLLSYGRRVFRNEPMTEDTLELLLSQINTTMLYDENGDELSPLDKGEIDRLLCEILFNAPGKAPEESRRSLGKVNEFLNLIYVPLSYKFDGQWKVLKSLCRHGLKYSSPLGTNKVKVYIAWTTLSDLARISSHDTLSKALNKLICRGMITKGNDYRDKSGYFVLNIDEILNLDNWNLTTSIDKINFPFASYLKDFLRLHHNPENRLEDRSNVSLPLSHYYGPPTPFEKLPLQGGVEGLEPTSVLDSFLKTSWYRGVGPSNQKYVVALILCGGRATVSTVSEMRGVSRSTVSTAMKSLLQEEGAEGRILWQDEKTKEYCLPENLFEDANRFLDGRGQKTRDFEAKNKTKAKRASHKYYEDLKSKVYELLKAGYGENEALKEARRRVALPVRVRAARVHLTEDGALKNALKRLKKEEVHVNSPAPNGRPEGSGSEHNRSRSSRGDEAGGEFMFLVA